MGRLGDYAKRKAKQAAFKAVDRSVDKVVDKTLDKVVDETLGKMVDKTLDKIFLDKVVKIKPELDLVQYNPNDRVLIVKALSSENSDPYRVITPEGFLAYTVRRKKKQSLKGLRLFDYGGKYCGEMNKYPFSIRPAFSITIDNEFQGTMKRSRTVPIPKYKASFLSWRIKSGNYGSHFDIFERRDKIITISMSKARSLIVSYIKDARKHEIYGIFLALLIDIAHTQY